jgi:hypothetical protein
MDLHRSDSVVFDVVGLAIREFSNPAYKPVVIDVTKEVVDGDLEAGSSLMSMHATGSQVCDAVHYRAS